MAEKIFRIVTTGPYLLPSQAGGMVEVPLGSTVNRVMSDPDHPWVPPDNTELRPDDGTPIWSPPAAPVMVIDAYTWLQRIPSAVQLSIAIASQRDPRLLVGMTLLGASGTVDLNDSTGQLRDFLALAVAGTAGMSDPLTQAAADAMLRP